MYHKILQLTEYFLLNIVRKFAFKRWNNMPFGKEIRASRNEYLKIAEIARNKNYSEVDDFEKETGFRIDQDWYHELALHTQVVVKKSEINYVHGRLLYSLLSQFLEQAKYQLINILETGTARGFSSLCMAKALFDANRNGKIITFDVLPHNRKMYWNCIDDHNGLRSREELLGDYNMLIENYILYIQANTRTDLE